MAQSFSPVVRTKIGKLIGKQLAVQNNAIDAYLGIKYASYEPYYPPMLAKTCSNSTLDCTKPAPFMPQSLRPTQFLVEYLPFNTSLIPSIKHTGYANIGELHLNIFCPKNAQNIPVMVWIHGGGFYIGGASQFDPSALVATQNVIVVCINYRLGAAGFLPEFTTNNGLRDQIVALQWIQEHIEDFGGDKTRVTIFGESAGGMSVDALVHSPVTKNLFHCAISQSGTFISSLTPCNLPRTIEAYTTHLGIDKDSSISTALNKLPRRQMLNLEATMFGQSPFSPTVGDDILPIKPEDMNPMEIKGVPYMIGRCSGEGDALLTGSIPIFLKAGLHDGFSKQMFEMVLLGCMNHMAPQCLEDSQSYINQIIGTYKNLSTNNKYFYSEIFCKWWGDVFLGLGTVFTADNYCKHNETFHYEMTHRSEHSHNSNYSGMLKLKPSWSRCDHCDDTVYMFGVPFLEGKYLQGNIKFTEEELLLSKRMMNHWANFAKTGNPEWPQYNPQTRIRKIFSIDDDIVSEWEDIDLMRRKELFGKTLYSINSTV